MSRGTPPATDAELDAEIEDRLWRSGIEGSVCACGGVPRCPGCAALRHLKNQIMKGFIGAAKGVPAIAGQASMARLGYHPDGRSRAATTAARASARSRRARNPRAGDA